ncbi:MAG: hypothetical protein IJV68_06160 [Clostridia bacterium]|nr:hypothetical protein [Clostridia bacterium]
MRAPMSPTRRIYFLRLIGRVFALGCAIALLFVYPESYNVIEQGGFFSAFSPHHVLWGVWIIDIICQIFPVGKQATISLGSMKLFKNRFKPIKDKVNKEALKSYIISTTKGAYKVFFLWLALLTVIGVLYYTDIIDNRILFLISVLFYVCDLICVLFWCPFRLIMKNRCCTTCRIFNWDHLMMFTPMLFIGGFYSVSLLILATLAFLVWEMCVLIFPERFWEHSNTALKCSECTDKLCTQYCRKLRK